MNWYRENRWLASFLGGFGITLLLAIWFVLRAKADFADASTEFNGVAAERERLEQLNLFPDDANFINTQRALQNYVTTLSKVKSELKSQVVPLTPLLPNEFQTRLRDAIVNTTEAARINRVQLSENFHLGFDEFTAVLPETAASPVLGQQLNQVELLVNILIDSHVDALTDLMRSAVPAKPLKAPPPPARTPATEPSKVIERSVVELAFIASPNALRKALNQIASCDRQFFIVRTLHVRSDQPKGPSREELRATSTATSPSPIKFIVGEEHLAITLSVELVRFEF